MAVRYLCDICGREVDRHMLYNSKFFNNYDTHLREDTETTYTLNLSFTRVELCERCIIIESIRSLEHALRMAKLEKLKL